MLSALGPRYRPGALALVLLAAVGSGTVRGGVARAQDAGAAAEAQVLFDEARKLMNKGDFAHACPKFAASQQADPAAGTLLNLANCYEKNGQTASAWVTFKDAAAAARTSNHRDWETRASEHVAKLEKVLSRLTVRLGGDASSPAAAQLTIRRDDTAVGSALLGTAIPVDPGTHTVDATAPGKKPFHISIDVAAGGERKEVIIPALEDAPAEAPPPVATSDGASGTPTLGGQSSDGGNQRTVGIVLGGVGLAGGIVGAVTGIVAIGKNSSAKSICPDAGACPSQAAVNDSNSAHSFGTVSTVSIIAGGAFFAGGVVTYLLAPRHPSATSASSATSPSVTAAPLLASGQAGIVLAGHF
jgi:hypothetical protein